MLKSELNSLQEELNYHKQAIEELEQRIAETKAYEAFTTQASEAVEEAIKQIGVGKYLWLFKEHLMGLFPQEQPKYLEEKLPSALQEQPNTPPTDETEEEEIEEKPKPKTRAQILGIPDFTPTTYKDISPDIVYSSEGRCYVGFSNYNRAKNYGNQLCELYELTSGFLVDKSQIMMKHKYELKFWCSEANARRLVGLNLKKELDDPVNAKVVESWKRVEPAKSQPIEPKPIPITELEVVELRGTTIKLDFIQ